MESIYIYMYIYDNSLEIIMISETKEHYASYKTFSSM